MLTPKALQEIASQFCQKLPPAIVDLGTETQTHLHELISSILADLDLVTRETLDVQQAVLAKTRAKVEALEKRVNELEEKL